MRKRIILILTAIAAIVPVLVLPATKAYASNDFDLCTVNGNQLCIGDTSLPSQGDPVTEWANGSGNARDIHVQQQSSTCAYPAPGANSCVADYILFYNGDRMRTPDACNGHFFVGGTSDSTGVIWDISFLNNGEQIINQHCAQTAPEDGVIYSDNQSGNRWNEGDFGTSGAYYLLSLGPS